MMCVMYNNEKDLGMSLVAFEENGLWGVKREETGEVVCKPEFDSIDYFFSGYAVISKSGKRGFIDGNGRRAFEEYCDVKRFVNGLAAVKLFFERWTFIDEEGNMLTKNTYREVGNFDSFYYAVVLGDNDKYSVINRDGVEVIKSMPILNMAEMLDPVALISRAKRRK